MRRPLNTLPIIFAFICIAFAPAAQADTTAFVGATLVDGTGGPPVPASVVIIKGDRIIAAGAADAIPIPADATIVDVANQWLTPGLVDSHMHFFQSGGLYARPDIVDLRCLRSYESETTWVMNHWEDVFRRYVASGVTAVVDVGGPFSNFVVRAFGAQVDVAPRIAVAGPLVATVSRPQMDIGDPPIIKVENVEEARALVRKQLERKPDLIKIWYIVPKNGGPRDNQQLAKAIIDTAHAGGVRVAVHATQLEAARAVVEVGADILVHSVDDAPVDQAFIALLKEKGTILTTTLTVYEGYAEVLTGAARVIDVEAARMSPAVRNTWDELAAAPPGTIDPAAMQARKDKMLSRLPTMQANLKTLWDAGVVVSAGTDAGNIGTPHGPALHRELELMAAAGLTPGQVLVAATRNAARVFAQEPDFGTLVPGNRADLLILNADPLKDVRALRAIHRVVLGGRVLVPDAVAPQDPATVFQRMHAAVKARDLDAFMALFSPGYQEISLDDGTSRGFAELAAVFKVEKRSPLENRTRIVTGDFVVEVTDSLLIGQVSEGRIERVWTAKAPTQDGAEAVVQAQVDAYNARNVDTFAALYAEDVRVHRLPEGDLILDGRSALRERYASFFEVSPDLNCTVVRRIVAGPWVVDREVVTGARGGAPLRAVAIYKVQDDLIQTIWFLPKEQQ